MRERICDTSQYVTRLVCDNLDFTHKKYDTKIENVGIFLKILKLLKDISTYQSKTIVILE